MDALMEVEMVDSSQESAQSIPTNGSSLPTPPPPPLRDAFRDILVKVHLRRPDRDSWFYLGKALVSYVPNDANGSPPRVVARSFPAMKEFVVFSQDQAVLAERRGNFVILSCVDGSKVVSWSFNAMNNSETIRLLAIIELTCTRCKQALYSKTQRRIERVIKYDRRQRHRRRKESEALIEAFSKTEISEEPSPPPLD